MQQRNKGLTSWGVLVFGLLFAAMGAMALSLGRAFNIGGVGPAPAEITAPAAVQTTVLLLLMFSMAAIPIFAVLLVDGFGKGENIKHNLIGLGLLAVISEIPYNLVLTGNVFSLQVQNPVFALLICEILLWAFECFSGRGYLSVLIWVVIALGAILLCGTLGLMEYGLPLLLATWVVWGFRRKSDNRAMGALLGSLVCAFLGLAYLTAPIGALIIHFYNGEKSEKKYLPCYLAYPVILLVCYGVSFLC